MNREVKAGLFALALLIMYWQPAQAASRIAFVVGNSDYQEVKKLPNPKNDAADIGARLQSLGFVLHGNKVHYDLGKRALQREYNQFTRDAKGAEIAFIYFAGHGLSLIHI